MQPTADNFGVLPRSVLPASSTQQPAALRKRPANAPLALAPPDARTSRLTAHDTLVFEHEVA